MQRNTTHRGLITVMYSGHSKPLQLWDKKFKDGGIKEVKDFDVQGPVLEIMGDRTDDNYITSPVDYNKSLGIKFPILNMTIKNMKQYFAFQVQVLDDKNCKRRIYTSNFLNISDVKPFLCKVPLVMEDGWNQVQVNLAELIKRAYGTNYVETIRLQIHSSCRIRRIFFSDRLVSDDELPQEYKLLVGKNFTKNTEPAKN